MALLAAAPGFSLPVERWAKAVNQSTRTALQKRGAVRITRQSKSGTRLPVQMVATLAATERPRK